MTPYDHSNALDIRCALARSAVLAAAQLPEQAVDLSADALDDAMHLGYGAAQRCAEPEVPLLFRDTDLAAAFDDGVRRWHQHDELRNCAGCRESGGDPCPFHG